MGEPIRILDVAKRLVAQSRREIEIVFTGLRPGEKMHEILVSDDERGEYRHHPLISHVPVPPLNPASLVQDLPSRLHTVGSDHQPEENPISERAHLSLLAGHQRS